MSALKNRLEKSKKIVFLTGAGISQESGIATFRMDCGKDMTQ
jgi:NAD-dependent SIR2 family protein deacetylase